jgi:hypothetical protein
MTRPEMIKKIVKILRTKVPSLTIFELIDLSFKILEAIECEDFDE